MGRGGSAAFVSPIRGGPLQENEATDQELEKERERERERERRERETDLMRLIERNGE